jgi:TonB family protein
MFDRSSPPPRLAVWSFFLAFALALAAPPLLAQNRGASRTKYTAPAYPPDAAKDDAQGNVLLIGRIDAAGNVTDLRLVAATREDFVAPAREAVGAWKFAPAMIDGKAVSSPLNAGVRFRVTGGGRGRIPRPILGDVAIFPANASGAKTGPDGMPLRLGKDPALRAEIQLDVPPAEEPRTIAIQVEASSPSGRKIPFFQPPVAVPALATEVAFPLVAQIGTDWEEGVWIIRFTADGYHAGGGQFWLAKDPATFAFALPTK